MTFPRHMFSNLSLLVSLFMLAPMSGFAQVTLNSFSLTWNGGAVSQLVQGDCFDLTAGPNAGGITLDIRYNINGGPTQYIDSWPTLDGNGRAENICTSMGSELGPRTFTQIRDHANGGGPWFNANYGVTILAQPTGGSFGWPQGYAGMDSYRFRVTGAVNRSIRVRYDHGNSYNEEGVIWVDDFGDYRSGTLDHYSYLGHYVITGVQLAEAQPGNYISTSAVFDILPPQPQNLMLDKTSIVAGGPNGTNMFRMYAINGGEMAIDYQYTLPGGGGVDYGWPYLYGPGWDWNGVSEEIYVSKCSIPGPRSFTAVKNALNGDWVGLPAPFVVNIVGTGSPSVSSTAPASANRGQSLSVTINGQNLCGVTLTTNYSGLTFSNIAAPDYSDGTSMTATFNIAAGAAVGNALVTLHARGGNIDFNFGIVQSGALPTISGFVPSSAPPGSTLTVTMTGTNFVNPVLSTTWSGLAFSNVVPNGNGTSLTATFTISGAAPTGSPSIKVTTPTGFVTTTLFAIGSFAPALSREYIYLGDRVIAADSP